MAQLGRFTHTAASSSTGLPVSGASVTIYREGATVNDDQSGTSPLTVTVHDIGKIEASDTVFINTTTGTTYNVNSVSGRTSIVLSGFSGTLSLSNGDRIIPSNSKPTVYTDDQGADSGSNPLTTSATGLASCFIEGGAYDYIVSGGSLTTTLFSAMVAPIHTPGQVRFADEFATNSETGGIQEAIDDLPTAGGKVVCSSGKTYTLSGSTAATASIWLHSNVELVVPSGCTIQRGTGSLTSAVGVICAGPKGSNGTEFSSGSTGAGIRITGGGTIDGNQSNFTSNVGHGIRIKYTDGLVIDGVVVQNTEQDGIYLDACRNTRVSNFHLSSVGQSTAVTQRNGISIYNNGVTTGWGQHIAVSNGTIYTVGAAGATAAGEGISLLDVSDVAVSNVTIDGCDYALELNAHDTGSEWNRNLTFTGIVAKNVRFTCIAMFDTVAATWRDIAFTGCTFEGHSTLHNGAALWVNVNSTGVFNRLSLSNCIFINLNTSDTASRNFVHYQSTTGAGSNGLIISNCQFHGKNGTTVTTGGGMSLNGGLTDALISNVLIKDPPGIGFSVGGVTSVTSTARNVVFSNCIADTCTDNGYQVTAGTATTTQYDIHFNNCIAKDCGINGNNAHGWLLQTSVGVGAIVQNVYLRGCKALKTAGTFMVYGFRSNPTAATTLDGVFIDQCDFSSMQTGHYQFAGSFTPTNLHITPVPGRGTDIASAATISIPVDGDVFHVTGTTNITNGVTVNGNDVGRLVTLVFDDILTMTDATTSVMAGNFTTSASDTLTLRCDGTNWYEVGRSVN